MPTLFDRNASQRQRNATKRNSNIAMKLSTVLLGFAATVSAALNGTQEFRIKTCLKPSSYDKVEFEDLYL